jgi:DNA-binding NarL/FixJ family response regulator
LLQRQLSRIFGRDIHKSDWSTMKRIRVLVANQPRLMRELIMTTIADQPDIELAGEVGKQDDLADAVAQTRPDVLILGMDDREKYRVQCGFLLGRYPEMKILALAPEQNRAQFYWAIVDVRSRSLESSEAGILDAMRQTSQVVGLARA